MKATELNLENVNYNMSCNTVKCGQHYKFTMRLGRMFPTTKAQAVYFASQGICLGALNANDVDMIEKLMNKHGFEGDYKYTKSKVWVRLKNNDDLIKAIKLEFNICSK
jgi:hypothetical protein